MIGTKDAATATTSRKSFKVTYATWPEALPHAQEDKIFSIICGNTTLKWTLHDGGKTFKAVCSWTTQLVKESDFKGHSPSSVLSCFLPDPALCVVFGSNHKTDQTKQSALEQSHARSATVLTVYLVVTHLENAQNVVQCFSDIPSRVYALNPDDFFTTAQGRDETMAMDRLVCLRGAQSVWNFPALVITADTSISYTACDEKEHIVGGGITVGIKPRFRTLALHSKCAPGMSNVQDAEEMYRILATTAKTSEPLGYFQRDTESAVIVTILNEIGLLLHQVIKNYLDNIYSKGLNNNDGKEDGKVSEKSSGNHTMTPQQGSHDAKPTIVLCGEDAPILEFLLKGHDSHRFDIKPSIHPYVLHKCNSLASLGVSAALQRKYEKYKGVSVSDMERKVLGCRVAKAFDVADEHGDRIFRGTVTASIRDKDGTVQVFDITYDDADREEMDLVQLHAALTLYTQVGEKRVKKASHLISTKIAQKKNRANAAARELEAHDPTVRDCTSGHDQPAAVAAALSPTNSASSTNIQAKRKEKDPATASAKKVKAIKHLLADPLIDPYSFVHHRIAKQFDHQVYFGTVHNFDKKEQLWQVNYDDGDEEEFDKDDLVKYIQFFQSLG